MKETVATKRSTQRVESPSRAAQRRLAAGAGLLSLSVLADSSLEHYRGSFRNRAMFAPLASAGLTLVAPRQ